MTDAALILRVTGLVCFIVAAFTNVPRVNLVAAGLALWAGSTFV